MSTTLQGRPHKIDSRVSGGGKEWGRESREGSREGMGTVVGGKKI